MAVSDEYVAYLADLYEGKLVLTFKKMFGGMGVYANGLSIGVIIDDIFHGKTDERSRPDYIALGAKPFTYSAKGKQRVIKAWYEMPDSVMEDTALFTEWTDRCYEAALQAAAKNSRKTPKPSKAKTKAQPT